MSAVSFGSGTLTEDLAVDARDLGVGAVELDWNRGVSQIGSHGEVCNRGDESDGHRNVMEYACAPRDSEAHPNESHRTNHHHGCNRPIPIRAMGSNVDIRGSYE